MVSKQKLRKCLPLLRIIKGLSKSDQKILLAHIDEDGLEAVYECVHNALSNTVIPVEKRKKLRNSLKAHKEDLRFLTASGNKKIKRRKLLQLGGNPLDTILSTVLPILTSFLI